MCGLTAESTKVNGLPTRSMAEGPTTSQTDRSTMETSRMTSAVDQASSTTQTANVSKALGAMARRLAKVPIFSRITLCIPWSIKTARK
jgi:hypothetical protein